MTACRWASVRCARTRTVASAFARTRNARPLYWVKPERRNSHHRANPNTSAGARHNQHRVKKPGDKGISYARPPTIRLVNLAGAAWST